MGVPISDSSSFFVPRLSTPGPNVDRWEDDSFGLDLGAISDLFGAQANAQQLAAVSPRSAGKPPTPTPTASLTIGNPTVEQQSNAFVDYFVQKREASEFNKKLAEAQKAANDRLRGAWGKASGGGLGKSAYGYSGPTGVAGTKGAAPYGLQPQMWDSLGKLNAALAAAGLGQFKITDGWRSYEQQVNTKAAKGNLAATPGNSIHGIGLAADLDMTSAQKAWLHDHAAEYGLQFLAPAGKPEDWHIQLAPSVWNSWASSNNFSW